MAKHLINYDLCTPGKNYDDLIEAIKAYEGWAKICKSCWAVSTNSTDTQICNNLKQYMDSNDVLFVCPFNDWASLNLSKAVVDWLNK
ncbi:MAG: SinR family protein [Oscillospiraceae bacterium]|nr:SinR family protein [Oscillospiraceae bacterium]